MRSQKRSFFLFLFGLLLPVSLLFVFSHIFKQSAPVPLTTIEVKQHQIGYMRQVVTATSGGEVKADSTTVILPQNFTEDDVVVSFRAIDTDRIKASHQVDGMFELIAKTSEGENVTTFDKPLQITTQLDSGQLAAVKDPSKLALYFFNTKTKKWEKLDSTFDPTTKQLLSYTTHFTVFMVADSDPNAGVTQPTTQSFIVDDGDPRPAFDPDGQTDADQPSYWDNVGFGYNGNARWTGNSINATRHNWATWSVFEGLTGEKEVFVAIPAFTLSKYNSTLTHSARYKITHAGGETEVVVDQAANAGNTVSLGTFTFNGSGAVYLDDVVAERGRDFISHIVFDAVSFGPFDAQLDITPPKIEQVKSYTDQGTFYIQAKVTDEGSGVDTVAVFFNGQFYSMRKGSGDIYNAALPYSKNVKLDYYIVASDKAGNQSVWNPTKGYISRGAFYRMLGYPPGTYCSDKNKYRSTSYASFKPGNMCDSQFPGDPINPFNGNFIERMKLVIMPGRPEIDFNLTYNSLSGRPSIFGYNWTHGYNYHLIDMDNEDVKGAFVQFPDGQVVRFSGQSYTPEPGHYETLIKTGDNFILTFKDLSKAVFDADGDITRWEDANGNGITLSYSDKAPYTLLSKLTSIKADGGREVTLEYNDAGWVKAITSSTKALSFGYAESGDLTSFIDGRGGETKFEYTDHLLTKKISPKGHPSLTNEYDSERRVSGQVVGASSTSNFSYESGRTIVKDIYSHPTTYVYNSDGLVTELIDAKNKSIHYEYTGNRDLKKFIDRDNHTFEYTYDSHGNRTYEKDPLGFEVTRAFDTRFNKPTSEVYKQQDHKTSWEYDDRGNLRKITNAKNDFSTFDYNNFGQLTHAVDFNSHPTDYTYNTFGDVETITDAEQNAQEFRYDGLGRLTNYKNPKKLTYQYTYDGNDNLRTISGPLSYKLEWQYDANDHVKDEIDANGGVNHYAYDLSENLTEIKNQLGFVTRFTYGQMNEKLTETSPEGRKTAYGYDEVFNVTAITRALGTPEETTTRYEYNGMRDVVKAIDPEGRITAYEYDPLHRLTQEVRNVTDKPADSENNVSRQISYTPTGVLKKLIDPNGNAVDYTINELDQVTDKIDAENQTTQYEYDKQGNLVLVKNPRSFITTYMYDDINRLETITNPKQGKTTFGYDPNSNLVSVKDPNSNLMEYHYNDLDRRTDRVQDPMGIAARTEYAYDLQGNLTSIKNPRGFTTRFHYDAAHRNDTLTDPDNFNASFGYDKDNNLTKIIDRNGHTKEYTYDSLYRLTQSTNAESHVEKLAYDKVGNITKKINPRGKEFTYQYDPLNRVKIATNPYQKTALSVYDAVGNLLSFTDENGHTDRYEYDTVYRLTRFIDAENNPTQYQYDKNGNITKKIDAESNPVDYVYDELDRLTSRVNAEGETEKYGYDHLTNLVQKTESDSTEHQYAYDALYRLVTVVNNFNSSPAKSDTNVTTRYEYDKNGNLTKTIDPLKHVTAFEYDKLDRLHKETNPLENTWQYAYDPEGNLRERLDANRVKTAYEYYPDDQLKKIAYPAASVEYAYNETNFPVSMKDNLGTTTWEYDDLDRLVKQVDPLNRTLGYEYDFVGNLRKLNYPDGRSIAHSYLKNDWLSQSANSDSDTVDYTRNRVGLPVRLSRSNSTYSQITYDKVYRPLLVHDQQIGSGDHLINEFTYSYNKVGHITREVAKYGWRQPDIVTTDYAYDGLHRLTDAASDDGQSSAYSYDAAGNRTTMVEKLKQGPETRSYTYNPANQLTQIEVKSPQPPNVLTYKYQYDKNGNRIDRLALDNTGIDRGTSYSYDTENRLTRAQDYQVQLKAASVSSDSGVLAAATSPTPTPTVSSQGNGKEKKNTPTPTPAETVTPTPAPTPEATASAEPVRNDLAHTDLAYDGNGRRLVSTYFSGSSDGGKRTEYTFDRLDPVVEYAMWNGQRNNMYRNANQDMLFFQEFKSEQAPNGTAYWYHHDGRGNIAATTKFNGQSDHSYRYDEYGTILPENGNPGSTRNEGSNGWIYPHNAYTLTQKQYDGNTNLYYFGARHYDPMTGIWMSQDTYRGELVDPASKHRYLYNYASPVNYVDRYGNFGIPMLQQLLTQLGPRIGPLLQPLQRVGTQIINKCMQVLCADADCGNEIRMAGEQVSKLTNAACADGDCTNEVQIGGKAVQIGTHALERMVQRGVSLQQVQQTITTSQPFRYFHEGVWKTGYYDAGSKVFVAVTDIIKTVMTNVKPQYIDNLKSLTP